MKKLFVCAGVMFLAGIVLVLLPVHVQMSGVVLCLLGAAVGLCSWLGDREDPRLQRLVQILAILASSGVVILMACMNIVTTSGQSDWAAAEKSDYAVVLGAAVNEGGVPSRIMRSRLRAALEFMEKNPEAQVILSGGQGPDEPMSEAECMYQAMLQMGAKEARLIMEDESHTTRENLQNSMEIIDGRGGTKQPITIITSEFHQRRARYIAESLEIESCAVSGHTDQWFYRVNYTLREVFAFVKAAFQSGAD